MSELPVHFLTIVLNGEPWIRYHIEVFRQLQFDWHWHIVEGVAALKHDTAWSLSNGGHIPEALHNEGSSIDGTTDYLDRIIAQFPHHITVYRKPKGEFWDGKLEMIRAPIAKMPRQCLLWQVDVDELWTPKQIRRARELFLSDPMKRAAYFWSYFFVGPDLVITTRGTYGNYTEREWLRVWRKGPFNNWVAHEPPVLGNLAERLCAWVPRKIGGTVKQVLPPGGPNVFTHAETEREGLVFQHMAYVTESQVAFKQIYYGYERAVELWRALQQETSWPARLRQYFPWVTDESVVAPASSLGITPLMRA